jgi:hypothetical protein
MDTKEPSACGNSTEMRAIGLNSEKTAPPAPVKPAFANAAATSVRLSVGGGGAGIAAARARVERRASMERMVSGYWRAC